MDPNPRKTSNKVGISAYVGAWKNTLKTLLDG